MLLCLLLSRLVALPRVASRVCTDLSVAWKMQESKQLCSSWGIPTAAMRTPLVLFHHMQRTKAQRTAEAYTYLRTWKCTTQEEGP